MLCRGVDLDKDQSYVLFGISPARLDRMLLPIGSYRKPEIRSIAAALGLRVAEKRDSQEICFVPDGRHDEFVRARRGDRDTAGRIVTTDGRTRGDTFGHRTLHDRPAEGTGSGDGGALFCGPHRPGDAGRGDWAARRIGPADVWRPIARIGWSKPPPEPFRCQAKIRYNTPPAHATARVLADDRLEVEFDEPCYGVAPGQAVVCYDGDRVLGGGWIE